MVLFNIPGYKNSYQQWKVWFLKKANSVYIDALCIKDDVTL